MPSRKRTPALRSDSPWGLESLGTRIVDWYDQDWGLKKLSKTDLLKVSPATLRLRDYHMRETVSHFELVLAALRQERLISRGAFGAVTDADRQRAAQQESIRAAFR